MNDKQFWKIMDLADWNKQGDDEAVLAPVVDKLSTMDDAEIFGFEDVMAKLLYDIDNQEIALQLYGPELHFSEDLFLYQRCVALCNGEKYYKRIVSGKEKLDPNKEFESVLYVTHLAWAKKHQADSGDYPHFPEISYETGSNEALWPMK